VCSRLPTASDRSASVPRPGFADESRPRATTSAPRRLRRRRRRGLLRGVLAHPLVAPPPATRRASPARLAANAFAPRRRDGSHGSRVVRSTTLPKACRGGSRAKRARGRAAPHKSNPSAVGGRSPTRGGGSGTLGAVPSSSTARRRSPAWLAGRSRPGVRRILESLRALAILREAPLLTSPRFRSGFGGRCRGARKRAAQADRRPPKTVRGRPNSPSCADPPPETG